MTTLMPWEEPWPIFRGHLMKRRTKIPKTTASKQIHLCATAVKPKEMLAAAINRSCPLPVVHLASVPFEL